MKKKWVLGAKYFLKDKILNDVFEVQIVQLNNYELTYRHINQDSLKNNNFNKQYRELKDVEIASVINIENSLKINNKIFSIQTKRIKSIISRDELKTLNKNNFKDINIDSNTVLISITDPGTELLDQKLLNKFKDNLSIQFWDIEEAIGNYKPISLVLAKQIKDFILKHKNNNFVIHCEAGISRSAAVGLAVELLCDFKNDTYLYSKSESEIKNHPRYYPNLVVFDKIVK